jgi:transcriptional regulator with XRE-family HTH domain
MAAATPTTEPLTLPFLLRTFRELAGFTHQAEVARRLSVAASSLCSWEQGSRVPAEHLARLDGLYGAGHALIDLSAALGTPGPIEQRRVWSHNFPSGHGPVWLWLRPRPGTGSIRARIRWAAFVHDGDELCDDQGIFYVSHLSMPNPALWVELAEPGWVDFGRGILPPALGRRSIDALAVASIAGDGHSAAGLVAPAVTQRFIDDPDFADGVLAFFGTRRDLISHIFSTTQGWDDIDVLVGPKPPDIDPASCFEPFTGDHFRRLREARRLSQTDAARQASALAPELDAVTNEQVRNIENDRVSRAAYLRSRLDRIYRSDGRTGIEEVPGHRHGSDIEFVFPRYWVGPVWFTVSGPAGLDTANVRLKIGQQVKRMQIGNGTTITCRKPTEEPRTFTLSCLDPWQVRGGMGAHPEAHDANLGWRLIEQPTPTGPRRTVNKLLLDWFLRTEDEWNEFLERAEFGTDRPEPSKSAG